VRGLPYPAIGDQTSQVGICQAPHLAQDVVAGLEGTPDEGMRLRCRVRCPGLKSVELLKRKIKISKEERYVNIGIWQ
jgi:hypothetical protein